MRVCKRLASTSLLQAGKLRTMTANGKYVQARLNACPLECTSTRMHARLKVAVTVTWWVHLINMDALS